MNKIDEDSLRGMSLPPADKKVVNFYGTKGEPVHERERHFAKSVLTVYGHDQTSHHYYVRVGMGELIDPYGVNRTVSSTQLNSIFNYRKVSQKTFDSYIKYLETQNRIHFTTARRLLLSEN